MPGMSAEPEAPALNFPIVGLTTVTADDLAPAIALLPIFRQRWLFLAAAATQVVVFAIMNGGNAAGLVPFVDNTTQKQKNKNQKPQNQTQQSNTTMSSH